MCVLSCSFVSDSLRPLDCSLPGSSVHGVFQARILEQVAISFSRGSSWPKDWTHISCVSCIGRQILYHWVTSEAQKVDYLLPKPEGVLVVGNDCCLQGFFGGWWKCSIMDCGDDCTTLNILKTTEGYTLNACILPCVSYISIKLLGKKNVLLLTGLPEDDGIRNET